MLPDRLAKCGEFAARIAPSSPPAVAAVTAALAKYAEQIAVKRSG